MKHVERTKCQQCLQRRLFTELSDLMMRKRHPSYSYTPIHRLTARMSQIAYPWRLYDMIVDLARSNVSVLVGAGDNLVDALVTARNFAMSQAAAGSKQLESVRPVQHVPLRAPTWLHARVLLSAMIEIDGVRSHVAATAIGPYQTNQRGNLTLVGHCEIEIGFSLAQLAESCDPIGDGHQSVAELFHSVATQYMSIGRQANESAH